MELFQFVEHSFDVKLINKCKKRLGIETIKKINKTLNDLALSDVPPNDLKITVAKEKRNDDRNCTILNEFGDVKVNTDKESLECICFEKENTISDDKKNFFN